MTETEKSEPGTTAGAVAPGVLASSEPTCRPPANWRVEVAEYDAHAATEIWAGPRYRMKYRTLGEGPVLVLIPGLAGTYRGYAMVLNRLAAGFRTVVYDYPGDQPSDGARLGRIAHNDLVDDLMGLIDHLAVERAHLMGVSFGSTIAMAALARHGERFARSCVQGAFAARKFTFAERAALAGGRLWKRDARTLPGFRRVLAWNSQIEFTRPIRDRWAFYVEQNGLTPARALAHRCGLASRVNLRAELPQIQTPVLAIHGKEDRLVPTRYHEEVIRLLPHARSCILPTLGHAIHYTHPEREAALVHEYLKTD